jgi:GWxTD domain-containing protein
MQKVPYIISFITAAIFLFAAELLQAQPQRAYERGLEELYRGNTTSALDIWYGAYNTLGSVDGRIGLEFIRVVTENSMRDYYEQATELYYRALTDGSGTDSRVVLRQEIERMRPVIGEGIYRQWMEWWSDNNPELGSDMRGYWVRHDPTPSRLSNERLVEHWERISISKKRFTRNTNTIYGTDDRALIFVRYGEPSRTKSGILTLQSYNIRNWLQNQLNPYAESDPEQPQRDDRMVRAFEDGGELISRLQDVIYQFHRYPEYEIWFYDGIAMEGDDPVPFIFGTDVRSEEFRLQSSIEDFIPERAYSSERPDRQNGIEFTRAGITPALMLQLIYYEQLVQVDPFFETRLNELRDKVLEQGSEAYQGMDLAFRAESQEIINQRTIRAPRELSTYSGQIPVIPLDVYQYRFLDVDRDMNPYMLTYIESAAQEAFLIDYHRNRLRAGNGEELEDGENVTESFPYYEINHSLQEYDSSWNIRMSVTENPPLILNRSQMAENESRSLFITPHAGRPHRSASVELLNYDPDTRTIYNTPFSSALRGLNRRQFRLPAPLVSHTDTLEMADLVLGFQSDEEITEPFSFRVANNALIPFEETLVLHFEVYNLKRRDDDTRFTQFELTYRILPVDEEGNVRTDQAEFVLTLNFINEDRNVIEDLEIETADLAPGLYDLRVKVIDTVTRQEKERAIRFEVVE